MMAHVLYWRTLVGPWCYNWTGTVADVGLLKFEFQLIVPACFLWELTYMIVCGTRRLISSHRRSFGNVAWLGLLDAWVEASFIVADVYISQNSWEYDRRSRIWLCQEHISVRHSKHQTTRAYSSEWKHGIIVNVVYTLVIVRFKYLAHEFDDLRKFFLHPSRMHRFLASRQCIAWQFHNWYRPLQYSIYADHCWLEVGRQMGHWKLSMVTITFLPVDEICRGANWCVKKFWMPDLANRYIIEDTIVELCSLV